MLRALKGRKTSREKGRDDGGANVGKTGNTDRDADEVLEGECKFMSGNQPTGKLGGWPRDGKRQGPGRKAKGRRWGREAKRTATARGQTLKDNTTPRRVRLTVRERDGVVAQAATRDRERDLVREIRSTSVRRGERAGTGEGRRTGFGSDGGPSWVRTETAFVLRYRGWSRADAVR
jgi:hypothetical protein